jgi:DNA-binding SARP family transcriptional activator
MTGAAEFGLLGPFTVRRDGAVVVIPPGKQRALLAALLLSAGRPVSLDRLAEVLWGTAPPPSARVTLQNYVLRLRRSLADGGPPRIVTHSGGYQMDVRPGELDVQRFESQLAAGRAAARAGQWAAAAAALAAGLALWRGELLAGVTSPALLAREGPRLTELRLQALEARVEADLQVGRPGEVIAELRQLAAAEPLRERAHALLMTALDQDGQPAAALAAYEAARRVLADELGADPGVQLRQLHARIRARGTVPAPRREPAPVVPRQLPAAAPQFAGRGAELDVLTSQLSHAGGGTVVICVIAGTAGVGKSTLAVHWAHQAAGQFPDGQLHVDLRGFAPGGEPVTPEAALRGFLGALGVPVEGIPAALADQAALYRTLLSGRRMLVLLDNAADSEQVRPLLPGSPGSPVLVTSRSQLGGLVAAQGAFAVHLDVLPEAEARELLARRLGQRRVAAEPAAVTELIGLCAGLPLALAIAASRTAGSRTAGSRTAGSRTAGSQDRPLAALAGELREAAGRLDALATGDGATDVRAVLSWSYRRLSDQGARLFRLLSVHPGPDISAPAAASLAGLPLAAARPALRELASAHLLAEPARGRFAVHDLLRAYAAEQAAAPGRDAESAAARRRAADHYLHTGGAAALLLSPARTPLDLAPAELGTAPEHLAGREQAVTWLEAEYRVMLALVSAAGAAGLDAHAWQLAWALATFLQWQGHVPAYIATQRAGLAAAQRLGNLTAQAQAHYHLGLAVLAAGDRADARAHMSRSLALSQRAGDRAGEVRGHVGLGFVAAQQERYGEALQHARAVLRLRRADPSARGLGEALSAVGWYFALSGDYARALPYCEEALALERTSAELGAAAGPLDSVGYIHYHLGHYDRAIASYREALALYRQRGGQHESAVVLIHLGDAYRAAGDPAAAGAAWQDALDLLAGPYPGEAGAVAARLADLGAAAPAGGPGPAAGRDTRRARRNGGAGRPPM